LVTSKAALSGPKMDSLSVSLSLFLLFSFLYCLSNHDGVHRSVRTFLSSTHTHTHTQLEKVVWIDFTLFLRIGVGSSPIWTNPSSWRC
jgi:hypothetical protein